MLQEVSSPILYRLVINGSSIVGFFDKGTGMSVMSSRFYHTLAKQPKLLTCTRQIRSAGGDALVPEGECMTQVQIGRKILLDKVIII